MEKDKFKYDAFISYRHNDLDKYVAENLHRLIETYKMPKPVVEKYNITDNNIRRVFRDQEELPLAANLENPIIEALKESKFLIVICSPRLKESIWCKREINNFIKLHGRGNILCVLVEGEPKDSFPEELLYYEVKTKNKSGQEETKKVSCEPLAMDVRGSSKREIYKKLKTELIRIIAPMYNLDYDDIKRRHEERKIKKKVRILKIVTMVSIFFTVYSALLFFKIYVSSKQLKYDQSINLATLADSLLSKDDRNGAIEKAYQSVTEYNNNKMPITTKGIYELTESLGVYYTNNNFYPVSQLETLGVVESIKTNLDKNYLLSYDNSRELVLWNLNDEIRIKTVSDVDLSINENKYTFIGNQAFAYQNNDKEIIILNLEGNEINKIKLDFVITSINASENGNYIEISANNKIYIYETNTYNEIASYETPSNKTIISKIYFDEKEENIIFAISEKSKENTKELNLITYNINKKDIINNTIINTDEVTKILFKDDNLIALTKQKIKLNSNMIITSYNYKNGHLYYQKEYEGEYPLDISMNTNTLLVSSWGSSYLLDLNTGVEKATFSIGNKEVDSYSIIDSDFYVLFTSNGEAHTINGEVNGLNDENNDVVYTGLYNFNLSNYEKFLYTCRGILAYTNGDNRIIIYGKLENRDIQEIEYEEKTYDYLNNLTSSEKKSIIEEYNFKKRNLISNIFYSNDKKLLFVSYTDNTLEIYNNESKKILNTVEHIKKIDTYIGETENNEYLIKGTGGGYILNKDFELIAYVPKLYDYNNHKLILKSDSKYYEVKIYKEKELINIAKDKVNNK